MKGVTFSFLVLFLTKSELIIILEYIIGILNYRVHIFTFHVPVHFTVIRSSEKLTACAH